MHPLSLAFSNSGRKGNSGRPPTYCFEEEAATVLPPSAKGSDRAMAGGLGVSQTMVVMNLMKGGHLKKHNSKVKPSLKEHHIDSRLMYCLSMIDTSTINATRSGMYYQNMYDTVHIDEKWFNLMALKRGCLLAEGEPLPYRTTHHKPHVEKVQFLCAVGRPHVLPNGEYFDGKIGCWPIGHWETYTRGGTVNAKGSPKWVDDSIDGKKYYELLMDFVVPAILEKHPNCAAGKSVTIQQDGAPSHGVLARNPAVFERAMVALGLGELIKLITQPAQSPDTNVCDLGFFAAWQADYYRKSPRNVVEMIAMVKESYDSYDSHKLNRIWLSHQACMNEIIDSGGSNDYKLPHLNKDRLEREGELPEVLQVTADALPLLQTLEMI
jgi:hypothetical protein